MVIRQLNVLGQQRLDSPHAKLIESGGAGDFDALAGSMLAGGQALVVAGFSIGTAGALGAPAANLVMNVQGGLLLHPLATDSGTVFSVAPDRTTEALSSTNTRVQGSFTSGAVNFVGVDLVRSPDATTTDLVKFLDPTTFGEVGRRVPLARTMDYVIHVSTVDFSVTPGICPVARVTVDSSGNVTALEDARERPFRLGSGGGAPDALRAYPWPAGRSENTTGDVFSGGDKGISSLKEWGESLMTRLWEIGGGQYWYSPTADRNVQMIRGAISGDTTFTNGEYFEWDGTNLHWRNLTFTFDNSPGYFNDLADQLTSSPGLTDLGEGDCIYVDLDRSQNRAGGSALIAQRGSLLTLGTPSIPGSRQVIAWRRDAQIFTRDAYFFVGSASTVATPTSVGTVKLSRAASTPLTPIVLADNEKDGASGVPSLDAQQAVNLLANTGAVGAPTGGAAKVVSELVITSATTHPRLTAVLPGGRKITIADSFFDYRLHEDFDFFTTTITSGGAALGPRMAVDTSGFAHTQINTMFNVGSPVIDADTYGALTLTNDGSSNATFASIRGSSMGVSSTADYYFKHRVKFSAQLLIDAIASTGGYSAGLLATFGGITERLYGFTVANSGGVAHWFVSYVTTPNTLVTVDTAVTITTNTWFTLEMFRINGTLYFFINGTAAGSSAGYADANAHPMQPYMAATSDAHVTTQLLVTADYITAGAQRPSTESNHGTA